MINSKGFVYLHDRVEIEEFLRKDIFLNIYGIGDLDDFFWPYTCWFGHRSGGEIDAVVLLYTGMELPTLIALSEDTDAMRKLLESIDHVLPETFYGHFSPGLESVFELTHSIASHGKYTRMALLDDRIVSGTDCGETIRMVRGDTDEILEFYRMSYPGHWFDPRMLETGQYFGIRRDKKLVSVGGIHVFSPEYGVGTLGNIATLPDFRGRGLGRTVTARVCQSLLMDVAHIGLNVRSDNIAAVSCYKKLGFREAALYGEFMITKKNADEDE